MNSFVVMEAAANLNVFELIGLVVAELSLKALMNALVVTLFVA